MQDQVPHIVTVDCVEKFLDADAQEAIRANHAESCRQLHERFVDIAGRRGQIDAAEVEAIMEAIDLEVWREYGDKDLTAYLEHVLGYNPRLALERERVARELMTLPDMYESLRHGLHWSKVRELTRVATPPTEAAWLDAARDMNVRQIEELVKGREKGDLPSSPVRPQLVKQRRVFELSEETYALFRQWKAMLSDECGELLDDDLVLATACQRGLAGADTRERPASQIAYMICPSCRATTVDGAGIVVPVSRQTRDRALCDAEHLGDLEAETPERVTSSVTPRVRRQVLARDHHRCTVPGCRATHGLQIHHLEHQEDGGSHKISNQITVCSTHHQLHHAGRLAMRRIGHEVIFDRILDHGDPVQELATYDLTGGPDGLPDSDCTLS